MDRRSRTWRSLTQGALPVTASSPAPIDGRSNHGSEVVDGIEFDYTPGSKCFVCSASDEVRGLVDRLLVRAWSYKQILQAVEPLQEGVSEKRRIGYHSIRRHAINHLPADELAVRQVLERRAQEAGLAVIVGEGPIVTNAGVAEIIRNRGFEAVIAGERTPSIRETLEATKLLQEFDQPGPSAADEIKAQVEILLEVIRELLPEDQWSTLVSRFEARLAAIAPKLGGGEDR